MLTGIAALGSYCMHTQFCVMCLIGALCPMVLNLCQVKVIFVWVNALLYQIISSAYCYVA